MSVIFLNGCTSAGKSSIAKVLQDSLDQPYLLTGIDDAFAMIPMALHNHRDGFYFDRCGENCVRLRFGAFGLAVLKAHHRAVAAMASSGANVIADEVVLQSDLLNDWLEVLSGVDVFYVGVHCELDEMERRESTRGDRIPGQARGQYDIVHADMVYDFEVNTTGISPAEAADAIIRALKRKRGTLS